MSTKKYTQYHQVGRQLQLPFIREWSFMTFILGRGRWKFYLAPQEGVVVFLPSQKLLFSRSSKKILCLGLKDAWKWAPHTWFGQKGGCSFHALWEGWLLFFAQMPAQISNPLPVIMTAPSIETGKLGSPFLIPFTTNLKYFHELTQFNSIRELYPEVLDLDI